MSKGRVIVGSAVVLALGIGGYAYLTPTFAATCSSTYAECATWVRRQVDAVEEAYKKSELHTSVSKQLQQREILSQQKKAEKSKAGTAAKRSLSEAALSAKNKPLSAAAQRQQERANWSAGQRIAHGHTFAKHKGDFGFKTEDQMAAHIDRVISFASASNTKQLSRGRTAYWDDRTWSIVIVDPKSSDGGTAFKPKQGKPYFNNLK